MILEKVKNTIKRYRLIDKNDRIIVAVSGGPDSMALLYILGQIREEFNINLHVAHLDHVLRPDSRSDAAFVEVMAHKLNLPVTSERINIKKNLNKGSVEQNARDARIQFLCRVAKKNRADKIAIGHNLDDQAETVLMRILRGAGLYGLSAILPKRKILGHWFVRPLINIKRADIKAYLKNKKIRSRTDKTNLQDIYFRNKIRNNLLPLLEKEYSPNIKEILSNMAESIGIDYDYLSRAAQRTSNIKSGKINLIKIQKLHPAVSRLLIRNAISRIKGNTRAIDFQHVREIEDLGLNRPLNSIVDLPKGISVKKTKKYLSFYHR